MGAAEHGLAEISFAQIGATQICLGQVSASQVETLEIGPGSGATQQQLSASRFGQNGVT